jgi:hypothetical protein
MRCHDLSMSYGVLEGVEWRGIRSFVTPELLVNNDGWEVKSLSRKGEEGKGKELTGVKGRWLVLK